jgi:hypothetical protein
MVITDKRMVLNRYSYSPVIYTSIGSVAYFGTSPLFHYKVQTLFKTLDLKEIQ